MAVQPACDSIDLMLKGPNGEWRPTDPIAAAIHVAKLATGEIDETFANPAADEKRARMGGKARATALTPERRREIAKAGADARWGS